MTEAQEEKAVKKGKGCLGWLWRVSVVGLVVLLGLVLWLNGPGMRWLGPKVAGHFMEKAGMTGSLRLGGTLLGGVEVYDLDISSAEGALERVVVDRLETDYRFREVMRGQVRGVSGQGIHVDVRMVEKVKDRPPVDFAKLGRTLAGVRGKILPLELDLRDVGFSMKKEGERVVELESSGFSHEAGSDVIALELGRVIAPDGKFTQKQKAEIVWGAAGLTLDRLELLPIAGVRDVSVKLPEDGAIAANADLRLGDGLFRLDVGAGIKDVRLDLVEGELDFGKLLGGFGLGLPIKGRLTSLAVVVEKVFPEWQAAVGTAEVFVEGFSYDGWDVAEASVGVVLEEGTFSAKLAGKGFGSDFTVTAGGGFDRAGIEDGEPGLGKISGEVNVVEVGDALRGLDGKLNLPVDFTEFPGSTLGGTWAVELGDGFSGVEGDLVLKARDDALEATPLRVKARYDKAADLVTVESFEADGMVFSGSYGLKTQVYEARQVLANFDSARLVPWLEGVGQEVPGSAVVSMEWEGSGSIADGTMGGEVTGLDLLWKWKEPAEGEARPPVSVAGQKIIYNWPGVAEIDGLVVGTQGQTVKLDAMLKERVLDLESFLWMEGEEELASGTGKLPVPEDFSKWKEFLENDTRPLDLAIKSETLPLAKLRPWVKGLEQIDPKATGKVDLKIAGSLAEPEIDATVEIREVSVPGRNELPTTDVTLNLKARDGRAEISAEAVAPDYAPAMLKAEMPFLPRKWAQDPKSLMGEEISGTLDLPKIDLSRFQSFIPGAAELGGMAEGRMTIAGTVGDPDIDGELKLSGGEFRMDNADIPALDGIDLEIGTDLENVTIDGGVKDVEGGNVTIKGTLGLKGEGQAGMLDVSIRATGMPVVRNEFIIVRANADLRVQGTMQDARVTGEVGIIDSVFYKDMELIPIGKPFLEPSAAKLPSIDAPSNPGAAVPAPFSGWAVDVVVKTIDPILIRGNLGKGQVDAALRIEGKLGNPLPNGKVRLTNAVARLPFSTLDVREGTATFTPKTGFDPTLEIRGTAEPRPYRVEVYVSGRASDPQLFLTSQPPLPENEIMTLLATGTTTSGLEDSQAASSRAMQLLIEELRRGRFLFGKQLRPLLGLLDNVDFSLSEADPYDSDLYNSATLKLSDKWYVSAGIGSEGDQRVLAIWRLRFR